MVIMVSVTLLAAQDSYAQQGPVGDLGGSYRLIGTIGGNTLAGAVLSDGKGEQTFIRLNDRLPDGSQIVGVHADRISVKAADGTRYDMYISHETKPSSPTKPVTEARPAPPRDPYTGGIRPNSAATESKVAPVSKRPGRGGRMREGDE